MVDMNLRGGTQLSGPQIPFSFALYTFFKLCGFKMMLQLKLHYKTYLKNYMKIFSYTGEGTINLIINICKTKEDSFNALLNTYSFAQFLWSRCRCFSLPWDRTLPWVLISSLSTSLSIRYGTSVHWKKSLSISYFKASILKHKKNI